MTVANEKVLKEYPPTYKGQLPVFIKAMRHESCIEVYEQCGKDYAEAWQANLYTLTADDGDLDALFNNSEQLLSNTARVSDFGSTRTKLY